MGNNFTGEIFLLDAGNLMRSDFVHSHLFPKLNKQNSVNIENELKSKLVWLVDTEYEVKINDN